MLEWEGRGVEWKTKRWRGRKRLEAKWIFNRKDESGIWARAIRIKFYFVVNSNNRSMKRNKTSFFKRQTLFSLIFWAKWNERRITLRNKIKRLLVRSKAKIIIHEKKTAIIIFSYFFFVHMFFSSSSDYLCNELIFISNCNFFSSHLESWNS